VSIEIAKPNPNWPSDFAVLASRLGTAANVEPLAIDHIGSTAVSGLPAKDVIDAQVIVATLDAREPILAGLAAIGFRQRPGGWNLRDHVPPTWKGDPSAWDKLVVGPPEGERPANVHVRAAGSPGERYALLFRDFLRADRVARDAWASYKLRLAAVATNLETYGQVKDPATDVLLLAAEAWADETGWTVSHAHQ
jgi:GrpB-like predicted nucleotidyltransferase (UPF0157 family)